MKVIHTTAIVYHYFEKNQVYKENFKYFLQAAYCERAFFYVFISGECSIELPAVSNIKYIFIENRNNDFGAISTFFRDFFNQEFRWFVFVNSSVRGPFVPNYLNRKWYELYTDCFTEEIGIVGSTINLLEVRSIQSIEFLREYPFYSSAFHVQTYAYAMCRQVALKLMQNNFFEIDRNIDKSELVRAYEIRLTQEVLRLGFSIRSFVPSMEIHPNKEEIENAVKSFSARDGDICFKGGYFGRTPDPHETIFVKTNRDLIDDISLASYTFSGYQNILSEGLASQVTQSSIDNSYEDASIKFKKSLTFRYIIVKTFFTFLKSAKSWFMAKIH